MMEQIKDYWAVILSAAGVVFGYVQLQHRVKELEKDLNGIGNKVGKMSDSIHSNHLILVQKLSRIEGAMGRDLK